ncbi:hypothetical protein [Streptomyces sp. WAC08241]|uniref:hypothetical protein n=1 Tax=Streptomyces sp. WAC08241 TaxID=2487421 RepID=UPI0021AEB5BD|nr:hypothetical protein [Streptomyces sp. WAC08241]
MEPLVYVPADDSRFGAVVIVLDHKRGAVAVSGDGLPPTGIRRASGTPLESQVSIGTRDPSGLP